MSKQLCSVLVITACLTACQLGTSAESDVATDSRFEVYVVDATEQNWLVGAYDKDEGVLTINESLSTLFGYPAGCQARNAQDECIDALVVRHPGGDVLLGSDPVALVDLNLAPNAALPLVDLATGSVVGELIVSEAAAEIEVLNAGCTNWTTRSVSQVVNCERWVGTQMCIYGSWYTVSSRKTASWRCN